MIYVTDLLLNLNTLDVMATSVSSYLLIFAAEIGDKSQLVCMALAARYRALPVVLGSIFAFLLLNTLAVTFGVVIANWLPEIFMAAMVAILFVVFGIHALRYKDIDNEEVAAMSGQHLFFATFLLIIVAEFGDKTQLAVVALSSTSIPVAVWLGSTAALISISMLGILAGRTIFQRIPIALLHRIGGVIFILLAIFAAYKAYLLV